MERIKPAVTAEQLLKELANPIHVDRTQQTGKACQPAKEQGGGTLVCVCIAYLSCSLLAYAF